MTINKHGIEITTLDLWKKHAPPKSLDQWVDGFSAKELARAWLGSRASAIPSEVGLALAGHKDFTAVEAWRAEPEVRLPFDSFGGEPRNSDLVIHARDSNDEFLIAVEGKCHEPFGQTVADALAEAVERKLGNVRSNGVARIEQLAANVLGPRQGHEPALKKLRYQLLTACAGALCEAERLSVQRVILLIHEFFTDETDERLHARNSNDLNLFARRLSHESVGAIAKSRLYGPFHVPWKSRPTLGSVRLYLGKAVRDIRTSARNFGVTDASTG
jgi:hypothetical protein